MSQETGRDTSDRNHQSAAAHAKRSLTVWWDRYVLALIIISACSLSLYWVFTVPLFQNPDETSHADYVFSIYSANRLLNVRRPPSEWNTHSVFAGRLGPEGAPYERMSHQYTLYLMEATEFQRVRFHYEEKVPPGYGSADYYRTIDRNAPRTPAYVQDLKPEDNPWLVTGYPFGYYLLVAAWLKFVSLFASGPATLLLAARILSVIFLAGNLCLTYVVLRQLHLGKARALTMTFIVGFFPLTTFLSASVQPDNLTLLLVLLSFYLALRLQRRVWNDRRMLLFAGLMLGALAVTKYHIFLFTLLAIVGMLVSDRIFRRSSVLVLLRRLTVLIAPALLFFAVQLWVVWGGGQITGGNLHRAASSGLIGGVKKAAVDYFRGGPALVSWWGQFGWMDAPLVIKSSSFELRVQSLLSALTVLVLLLLIVRLEQVLTRLMVFVARGRWRTALRAMFSNPLVTSHLIFSAFMIFLYALTDNAFNAQGRHWFPYLISGFLITIQYAPRAFSHKKTQAASALLLIAGLVLYCLVGSFYSIRTIKQRYYVSPSVAKINARGSLTGSLVGQTRGLERADH